jgi:hypothetical protein
VAALEDELKSQQQVSGAPTSSYIRAVVFRRLLVMLAGWHVRRRVNGLLLRNL